MGWKERDQKIDRRLKRLQEFRRTNVDYKSPYDEEPPISDLVKDQEWRKPTSSRHIEELKRELRTLEQSIASMHQWLLDEREDSKKTKGNFLTEVAYRLGMRSQKDSIERAQELIERIDRIFRGDTKREVLELETEIEQLETVGGDGDLTKSALVDLRASLRELKAGGRAAASPDQQKLENYLERRQIDHRHQVEEEIGATLRITEEVMVFKKRRRKEIMQNAELTEDEKLELFEQLDSECAKYIKDLKDKIQVYEED